MRSHQPSNLRMLEEIPSWRSTAGIVQNTNHVVNRKRVHHRIVAQKHERQQTAHIVQHRSNRKAGKWRWLLEEIRVSRALLLDRSFPLSERLKLLENRLRLWPLSLTFRIARLLSKVPNTKSGWKTLCATRKRTWNRKLTLENNLEELLGSKRTLPELRACLYGISHSSTFIPEFKISKTCKPIKIGKLGSHAHRPLVKTWCDEITVPIHERARWSKWLYSL